MRELFFNDYSLSFVNLYGDKCHEIFKISDASEVCIKFVSGEEAYRHMVMDNTPFACGICKVNDVYHIGYDCEIIRKYNLTIEEQFDFVAHELGHILMRCNNQDVDDYLEKEMQADSFAIELGLQNELISGLEKIMELNPNEISQRIFRLQEIVNNTRK